MKRFYKNVDVVPAGGGFGVTLDGKPIKSPAKADFTLPSQALAEAIAAEWDAQADEVVPSTMPLMQLAATAIDKVAPNREVIIDTVAPYGGTDLLCYRAEAPAALAARQAAAWQPLLDWAMTAHDAPGRGAAVPGDPGDDGGGAGGDPDGGASGLADHRTSIPGPRRVLTGLFDNATGAAV